MVKTKQAQILLLEEDESRIVEAIHERFPSVRFINNVPWISADAPPAHESLSECGSTVAIWNPVVFPELPVDVRSNGMIFGPQVGPVVQWVRSREITPGVLDAGRWAASWSDSTDPAMVDFIGELWKILQKYTSNKLRHVDAVSGDMVSQRRFRVGPEAGAKAISGEIALVSTQSGLLPET
ncbi:hypothetical protein [Streptomyces sp. NPDC001980]|uniref:hypothetical protein n=1 Tax=Streptomyces sp. NPDC001980 TaxID=3157126 RepID=UPI00331DE3D0